jgi:hypothetical protein
VPGTLSLRVKLPGSEANHSPTNAEVTKTWNYTSTLPYTFMEEFLINQTQGEFVYLS